MAVQVWLITGIVHSGRRWVDPLKGSARWLEARSLGIIIPLPPKTQLSVAVR